MRCHIALKGHLDLSWQEWFGTLEILHEAAGRTVLHGLLVDQAALYRVLLKIHSLGLVLLSLETDEQALEQEQSIGSLGEARRGDLFVEAPQPLQPTAHSES